MNLEKEKLASDLKAHLQFLQSMGENIVPREISTKGGAEGLSPSRAPVQKQRGTIRSLHASERDSPSVTGPFVDISRETLTAIRTDVGDCQRCKLCSTRKNIVFGVGNPHAELMFIGEGPGADEDEKAEPFVGRAGQLLTKIIEAMGMTRAEVYINNIVMCRPPGNRAPEPDESASCKPFLLRRIAAIKPRLIVCLGATAVKNLLETDTPISKIRGKIQDWNGYKVMPTFHPAFLLRNPNMKAPVWEDMQAVLKFLGKPIPQKK